MNTSNTVKLSGILFLTWLFALPGAASAAEAAAAQAPWKVSQEVEAGYQTKDVDVNEAKFEEYGAVTDGTLLKSYSLKAEKGKTQVEFNAKDVKQNNQSYDLHINQGYRVKVDASWDQTPHLYSNGARTLYTEESPGVFRLPDNIQSALQALQVTSTAPIPTATFNTQYSSYSVAAHAVDLGIRDDKAHLGLEFIPTDKLKFDLGVTQDKIQGHRAYGASFGFNHTVQLPQPIDYRVYTVNTGSHFNTKSMQLGFNYAMSSFDNKVETLVWDNAKRLTDRANSSNGYSPGDQSAQGRMALAPDNSAHNVNLNAGVNLPLQTRFTADGSFGYYRQNEDLLPYTINSAIRPGGTVTGTGNFAPTCDASLASCLPVTTANAKMMTWTQNYALISRVYKPMTLAVRYRSYQLNNSIPETTFAGQVRFDAVWEGNAETSSTVKVHRFQYRKDNLETGVDWNVLGPLSVGAKYGVEWLHRTSREVRDTTEHSVTSTADLRMAPWATLRSKYVHARREMDHFEIEDYERDDGVLIESPGLRRSDVADRDRNIGRLQLDLEPGPLSFSANASLAHDHFKPGKGDLTAGVTSYTNTLYGLLESRTKSAGLDAGWDFSSRLKVSAYYQYEQVTSEQRSNDNGSSGAPPTQDAATDWWVRTVERYNSAGVGVNWAVWKDRLDINTGYDLSHSQGETLAISLGPCLRGSVVSGSCTASQTSVKVAPPDTQSRKHDVYIRTNIHVTKSVSVVLGYLFEKYDYTDYAVQNIPLVGGTAASQNNIYLGDSTQSYRAHVGTFLIKYKWY